MFDNWQWFNNLFGGNKSAKDAENAANEKYEELVKELKKRLKPEDSKELLFDVWNGLVDLKHLAYNAGFEKAKELFSR
jgi:hypothetical protein